MISYKYIFSLSIIPSRINYIESTIKSLLEQTLKPEKIILNIPKRYNLRFKSSIQKIHIEKVLNKYLHKIIINYIDNDFGPGTKLIGLIKSKLIKMDIEDTYIVLVDDDHIYKPQMLEYFDNYNKKICDNKLKVASYYCYNLNQITIGQGADGFFMKLDLLCDFEVYYDIIKKNDFILYHDDYYISYYFHLKQIPIKQIPINHIKSTTDNLIYVKEKSWNIDSLVSIKNEYNRSNLCKKIKKKLSNLKNEGKFDNIQSSL